MVTEREGALLVRKFTDSNRQGPAYDVFRPGRGQPHGRTASLIPGI